VEEKGLLTAFPVVLGEEGPEWTPLDPKGVTRLIEAVEKKGLRSPLTINALEALTEPGPMLPYDIENLMRMVLKPVQYTLWKEEWLTELKRVIAAAQDDPGHPVHGTDLMRLMGSAAGMATLRAQLAQLRPGELIATTDVAIGAFRKFACRAEPSTPWSEIAQGPTESFQEFADRLIKAVERSDLPRAVHGPVIVDCLKQRSLDDVKTLLRAAPGKISTPGEIIRYVLDKQKTTPLTNEGLAAAITNVMAVTSRPLRAAESYRGPCFQCGQFGHNKAQCPIPVDNEKGGPCFRCGQFGHIKAQCRAMKYGERDRVICQLCGKGGHTARQCRSVRVEQQGNNWGRVTQAQGPSQSSRDGPSMTPTSSLTVMPAPNLKFLTRPLWH